MIINHWVHWGTQHFQTHLFPVCIHSSLVRVEWGRVASHVQGPAPWKELSCRLQAALAQAQQEHGICVKHGVCG